MRKSTGRRNDSDSDSSTDQSHSKKLKRDETSNSSNSTKKLSEREREAELLKQYEESERLKHHEEIRKRLRLKTHSDSENETKKKTDLLSTTFDNDIYAAEDDDDDDRPSNSRRQPKESQHSKSLQNYVQERRKKQVSTKVIVPDVSSSSSDDEDETKSSRKTKQTEKLNVNEVYASSSSDDDEDRRRVRSRSPEDRAKRKSIHKRSTTISTKSELKSMTLTRFRMEKWCHAPFFADVAKGAFVRINIGQNNGMPVYRICEIRDVVETAKVYNLGSARTNKGLRLKYGDHERVFRLEFVSNREISDSEFTRWRDALTKKGLSLPTLEAREKKFEEIERSKSYVLSNREISKIVEEKKRFRKAPINYAVKKTELMKDIELAQDEQNSLQEKRLRDELAEVEQRATELDKKRTQNISALAEINRRNRRKTQQNIESALLDEARKQKTLVADPFTRSRCAPTLVSKAPQTKEELIRELQNRRVADEAAAKKKLEQQQEKVQKEKAKEIHFDINVSMEKNFSSVPIRDRGSFMNTNEQTDEMFASHNFELDVPIQLFQD